MWKRTVRWIRIVQLGLRLGLSVNFAKFICEISPSPSKKKNAKFHIVMGTFAKFHTISSIDDVLRVMGETAETAEPAETAETAEPCETVDLAPAAVLVRHGRICTTLGHYRPNFVQQNPLGFGYVPV